MRKRAARPPGVRVRARGRRRSKAGRVGSRAHALRAVAARCKGTPARADKAAAELLLCAGLRRVCVERLCLTGGSQSQGAAGRTDVQELSCVRKGCFRELAVDCCYAVIRDLGAAARCVAAAAMVVGVVVLQRKKNLLRALVKEPLVVACFSSCAEEMFAV